MNHKTPVFGGIAAAALLASCLAVAAPAIDQSSAVDTAVGAVATFTDGTLAQSFQPAFDNVTGAGIFLLLNSTPTGDVTISLFDALPTAGSTALATATDTGTADSWFDVSFATPVTVTPNTTYFLVFSSSNADFGIGGNMDEYSRGEAFLDNGSGGFFPVSGFDYAFRTFGEISPSAVPEPSSLALAGLALVAGFGATRRRKA